METGSERIFEPVRNAGVQMVLVVVSVFMHMKPSRCLAPLRYSEQAHIRGGLAGGGGGMPGMGGEGGGGGGPDGGGGSKGASWVPAHVFSTQPPSSFVHASAAAAQV